METGPGSTTPQPAEPGLRERKKQRTRASIFEAAMALFADRGYDHVTMAEIARAADVAPATVFTHYASKEDLFYSLRHEVNEQLRTAVRERAAEIGALAAVKEWQLNTYEYFVQSPEQVERSRTFSRLLRENPALWTRSVGFIYERQQLLTELLIEHYPDADPFLLEVAAAQIAGASQVAQSRYQGDLAAGLAREEVLARAAARTELVFDQVERGLSEVL
jgi:AcrR family transcriptional regulator